MNTRLSAGFRAARPTAEVSADLAGYLVAATAQQSILAGKRARAEHLARSADSVVDLGCATGDMLMLMSLQEHPPHRIVGVDHNADLLAGARERSASISGVSLVEADAASTPFATGEFDACLVERTLQHVPDPAAVVAEACRITRVGGRVLLVEPDWSTLVVHGADPDVTELVLGEVRNTILHPRAGRALRSWLTAAGASDITVRGETHTTYDLDVARFLALLEDASAKVRATADADIDRFWADLEAAAASGAFFTGFTLYVAEGHVGPR